MRSYPIFLGALFVLASGITLLQVAANPYVAILGKPQTASSRLTLTQAFNSLGTTIAPLFGSMLILSLAVKSTSELAALSPADSRRTRRRRPGRSRCPTSAWRSRCSPSPRSSPSSSCPSWPAR